MTDGISPIAIRTPVHRRIGQSIHVKSRYLERSYPVVAWLSLLGALLPPREMTIHAGVNFTPGKICMLLLFFPALSTLFAKNYRLLSSDFFALATAVWVMVAAVWVAGPDALLSAAGGESLEFFGAYLVGRAYLSGPTALETFVRALRMVTVVIVLFALADSISGRWLVHDTLGSLLNVTPLGEVYRNGTVRATATFDHPILLGTFLALTFAIVIDLGGSAWSRATCALVLLLGCVLAQSSAGILSWCIVVAVFFYDRLLSNCAWRWWALWIVITGLACSLFLLANAPLGWLITHLTLDPESAYFRYLIWDAAIDQIAKTPLTGVAFAPTSSDILNYTVDCVWLAHALRFGVPVILFLFLANVTAMLPTHQLCKYSASELTKRTRKAFSTVLVMFMFAGLTVHFWNYIWIFWGLCIGIRASLRLQPAPR